MIYTIDVDRCNRCQGEHKRLEFKMMRRPIKGRWSYWAECPTTGEPLLLVEVLPDDLSLRMEFPSNSKKCYG